MNLRGREKTRRKIRSSKSSVQAEVEEELNAMTEDKTGGKVRTSVRGVRE